MTPLRSCVASPSIGTSSTVEQGTLHCKATPPLQRLKFSGGNPEIPPRLLLALLDEPHHVAFRIGEESERDPARHLDRWLNGLATEAFDLVQCRLRVVNTNVERDVPRTLWRFADPAVDATPLLLLVHHAVFQRAVIRRAELPTERFRVELSQDARVAPQDLEMDDRIPHLVLHWASMRRDI